MSGRPDEGFAYREVAAGVGVQAWGRDLAGCFRQAVLAVFNLVVPLEDVRPDEARELQGQGEPVEALLVEWLNEALYLHDVEGFVLHDLDRPVLVGRRVHARLHGEPMDLARHPRGVLVKAVTFRDVVLTTGPVEAEVHLALDI